MKKTGITDERKWAKSLLISLFVVLCVFLVLFIAKGYVPFGARTLATNDANVQYLDFLLYYKDVLEGKNSISYTFSKLLGGTNIALFSYYLASPLNLLIFFFQKDQVIVFYHLLVLLKTLLATAAFSWFLHRRFPSEDETGNDSSSAFPQPVRILLPACYGLSQYVLSQLRNVIWLDGVYMLPLILLGVYRVVHGDRLWKLSVPVALSILFNWYTTGMNCLFTAVWFLLEVALKAAEHPGQLPFKGVLTDFFRYAAAMLLGLMCSAALFLPTVSALSENSKGQIKYWLLLREHFLRAPVLSVVETSVYGAVSSSERISLYCGALPLAGVLGLFTKKERPAQRLILAGLLLFILLMFFCGPLYALFNLLENPTSFWVRFSYLQIFSLLFIAAWVFLADPKPSWKWFIPGGLAYIIVLAGVHFHFQEQSTRQALLTAAALLILSVLLTCLLHSAAKGGHRRTYAVLLLLFTAADLGYQAYCMTEQIHNDIGVPAASYIRDQDAQIQKLLAKDSSAYRISQTAMRNMGENRLTANFNEALAYGYRSLSHYSSTADDRQLSFLNRAGYKNQAKAMAIVKTPILGIDSLLGVKYILSDFPVNGLREGEPAIASGEKRLYENPYALPMALLCSGGEIEGKNLNPFEYQNALYSSLLGRETTLYFPLEYSKTIRENSQHYRIMIPDGNFAVYGNI